jgi:4-hydroxybenzoate polyprenyltransferase
VALADIKLAHTVFALPFAALGAAVGLAASRLDAWRALVCVALVLAAMFFARTWAMLVNRLADARFDRENPRTAGRAVAAGRLTPRQGWAVAGVSGALFIGVCGVFYPVAGNLWPVALAVPVLAWIALYSYTKRFTAAAHLFLGSALAISPLCAALAVGPSVFGVYPSIAPPETVVTARFGGSVGVLEMTRAIFGASPWTDGATALCFIAGFIAFWVGGFDIAYALQDIGHDRRLGLKSIPAWLGSAGALRVSRVCHAVAVGALAGSVVAEPRFSGIAGAALAAVAALLVYEHIVLHRRGVAGLPVAFFTVNGIVSCVLGAALTVDLFV